MRCEGAEETLTPPIHAAIGDLDRASDTVEQALDPDPIEGLFRQPAEVLWRPGSAAHRRPATCAGLVAVSERCARAPARRPSRSWSSLDASPRVVVQ